jgi:hypothetical protein
VTVKVGIKPTHLAILMLDFECGDYPMAAPVQALAASGTRRVAL